MKSTVTKFSGVISGKMLFLGIARDDDDGKELAVFAEPCSETAEKHGGGEFIRQGYVYHIIPAIEVRDEEGNRISDFSAYGEKEEGFSPRMVFLERGPCGSPSGFGTWFKFVP